MLEASIFEADKDLSWQPAVINMKAFVGCHSYRYVTKQPTKTWKHTFRPGFENVGRNFKMRHLPLFLSVSRGQHKYGFPCKTLNMLYHAGVPAYYEKLYEYEEVILDFQCCYCYMM